MSGGELIVGRFAGRYEVGRRFACRCANHSGVPIGMVGEVEMLRAHSFGMIRSGPTVSGLEARTSSLNHHAVVRTTHLLRSRGSVWGICGGGGACVGHPEGCFW